MGKLLDIISVAGFIPIYLGMTVLQGCQQIKKGTYDVLGIKCQDFSSDEFDDMISDYRRV